MDQCKIFSSCRRQTASVGQRSHEEREEAESTQCKLVQGLIQTTTVALASLAIVHSEDSARAGG